MVSSQKKEVKGGKMQYNVVCQGVVDPLKGRVFDSQELEGALGSPMRPQSFSLTARLPIPILGKVLRNLDPLNPKKEIVRVWSRDKSLDLSRDGTGNPGDIGVSCSSRGDEAVVETFNISFREYPDSLTDRGMVWVFPGNPAAMHLIINSPALNTPGLVKEIIEAAERAVEEKLLKYFDVPA